MSVGERHALGGVGLFQPNNEAAQAISGSARGSAGADLDGALAGVIDPDAHLARRGSLDGAGGLTYKKAGYSNFGPAFAGLRDRKIMTHGGITNIVREIGFASRL